MLEYCYVVSRVFNMVARVFWVIAWVLLEGGCQEISMWLLGGSGWLLVCFG